MTDFALVQVSIAPVRAEGSDRAEQVTQLLFGEGVEILSLSKPWAHIRCHHDGYEGYMDCKQLIRLTPSETAEWLKSSKYRLRQRSLNLNTPDGPDWIYQGSVLPAGFESGFRLGSVQFQPLQNLNELTRNASVIELAQSYLNTPYLWGGRSITGIDCSGFTQVVFAMIGISLKRDASQQVEMGKPVEFDDMKAGDLAFFHNSKGKIIHVGIATGLGTILHASGKIREDKLDQTGIFRTDSGEYSHQLNCIKRMN